MKAKMMETPVKVRQARVALNRVHTAKLLVAAVGAQPELDRYLHQRAATAKRLFQ
jgi:hypothetical protein